MKKSLFTSAIMLSMLGVAYSRMISGLPRGEQNTLATADYGGVLTSTTAFSSAHSTVTFPLSGTSAGSGVFYGAIFSSGTVTDFVDIWDSTAVLNLGNTQTTRLYNVAGSTGGLAAFSAGFSGPPKPIRFNRGLIYKPGSTNNNVITILYNYDE